MPFFGTVFPCFEGSLCCLLFSPCLDSLSPAPPPVSPFLFQGSPFSSRRLLSFKRGSVEQKEREREEVAIVPTRKNACSNKKGTDAEREREGERESERTRRGLNLVFARSFRSTVVGGQGKKKRSSQHGLNVWSRVQTNVNQGTTR